MNADFPNITILGGGLLGGSLALALNRQDTPQAAVRLWARKPESVELAATLGITGATTDLGQAVASADLLILAVPVGSMADLVSRAIAAGLPSSCLITDVGSVKRAPHHSIQKVIQNGGHAFIGSHPMAGSERAGLDAASPDLFSGAACLLTNDAGVCPERAAALDRFWQALGCRTTWMSATTHDELVARISHLPHVIAASAARVCLKDPSDGTFGGGGLRDTTRVASGNPEMWAEILIENRLALLNPIRETLADLATILDHLEHADTEAARQWLSSAKHLRDPLIPPPPPGAP
jgi:prephenate dehydrogenase